jgi:hypothetical protein
MARGEHRALHPKGIGFEALSTPAARGALPGFEDEARAIVRFSRAVGLPEWLPDPYGLGIRLLDVHGTGHHQDLLLTSSSPRPVARHLPLPAWHLGGRPLTTLTRYRFEGSPLMIAAQARGPAVSRLEDLGPASGEGLEINLSYASPVESEWHPLATLSLGGRLAPEADEVLDLDPWHTGGGLEPIGFLNQLRKPAYAGSRRGRSGT